MTGWLIGIWGVIIATFFFASFFSSSAASNEPVGRYLYMVALTVSAIVIALGLMRGHQNMEE